MIDTAIGIQTANAIVAEPIEAGKTTGNNDAAIGLQHSGRNFAIRACAGIEAGVQRAIKVETCDPIARDIICEGETARSNDFSVRLRNDDIHGVIRPRRGDESGVELTGSGSCGAK